jgi:hypothetical protein
MAENKSDKVAAARDLGKKFNANRVIVLFTTEDEIGYASWGKTAALCQETQELADAAFDAVNKRFVELNEEDETEF